MMDDVTDPIAKKIAKPIPKPAPESIPYWEAAKEHRLSLPRCDACENFWFPPTRTCPHCLSPKFTWTDVSGRGKVFSFVTFHRVYNKAFAEDVPYAVTLIELEEGPRLISNVVGIPADEVRCDMPVKVVFDDVADGVSIPKFTPA